MDSGQRARSLRACGRVTGKLVFEQQNDSLLVCIFGGLPKRVVHCRAIWGRVVKPPEVETPDPIRSQGFTDCDRSLKNLCLLFERKICPKLGRSWAVF